MCAPKPGRLREIQAAEAETIVKAAVLRGVAEPLCIEDIQIDDPKAHEVLLRTAAVGQF